MLAAKLPPILPRIISMKRKDLSRPDLENRNHPQNVFDLGGGNEDPIFTAIYRWPLS